MQARKPGPCIEWEFANCLVGAIKNQTGPLTRLIFGLVQPGNDIFVRKEIRLDGIASVTTESGDEFGDNHHCIPNWSIKPITWERRFDSPLRLSRSIWKCVFANCSSASLSMIAMAERVSSSCCS